MSMYRRASQASPSIYAPAWRLARFLAELLARATWDPDNKTALRKIERVVLLPRLREVIAHIGFTRFEPDSLLESAGFELLVPRCASTSERPEEGFFFRPRRDLESISCR